jgi:ankyrin repeat protein
VAAMGFAAEVAHCLYLCGETWRKGDKGATNDMLARSMEKQGWAALLRAARAARREDDWNVRGSTQLIRAVLQNDHPRVLQLVQLGAPLELKDKSNGWTALHWACSMGHEGIARALLDGKYEGRGAEVDARDEDGRTPLLMASYQGHEGIVRLLLARGARQELQDSIGDTALHDAMDFGDRASIVALLCAAPGASAALALRNRRGRTPLGLAVERGRAACEAALRLRGALL